MKGTSQSQLPLGAATYLIHHIFLPPQLPQEDDYHATYELFLLNTTVDALSKFKEFVASDQTAVVDLVIESLNTLRTIRDSSGAISEEKLTISLKEILKKGGLVPLHIPAQNAGIIISKEENSIHVEAFELSPSNHAVIATKGRLQRSFPGPALSLSLESFEDPSFQAVLAQTLAKMSHQAAAETAAKARKAGRMHDEDRDTTHPKMVTELLMGFLRSIGDSVHVSRIWKNTRDEVMWRNSRRPWRRSPLWLLVRVTMQLVFSRSTVKTKSPVDLYKISMIFLMSHILGLSTQDSIPSDLLYAMNAKLARRLIKLDLPADAFPFSSVHHVMQLTNNRLETRWSKIIELSGTRYDTLSIKNLNFDRDVLNSLGALDEFVKLMAELKHEKASVIFKPKSGLVVFQETQLPTCSESLNMEYATFNLAAFEDWIASNLSRWLEPRKLYPDTCGELGHLIQAYHDLAQSLYTGNPEATSMMLLTILELWMACDESATTICAILLDYDPGIPQGILESMVLPFMSDMERLRRVEDYLNCRRLRANFIAPHIFQDFGTKSSFSARYFEQSPEHKLLLDQIEAKATKTREAKCNELRELKDQYKTLMKLHDESECEYHEVVVDTFNDFREQQHSTSSCQKCKYQAGASGLKIHVHEWPLPSNLWQARSTVFELNVPKSFGNWRDVTMFVLLDVLKEKYSEEVSPRSSYPLKTYSGLSSFFTPFSSAQRVGLLSQTKPHEVTHRQNKLISTTTEKDVCLENGLQYQYYDSVTRHFVDNIGLTEEVSKLCTYKLPKQSSSVQKFIFRPASMPNGPSPNTVIAGLWECPSHMSLDEFKALSTIPLGYRIQWTNLLLQLCVPSVDFKKVETALVILQTIYQAGPSSGATLRAGHKIVDDEIFCDSLLEALAKALQRVKANWESSQAVSIFVSLTSRLLSLTSLKRIKKCCLAFLSDLRSVTLGWVNNLRNKAYAATTDSQRIELSSKGVEIALICVDTFNMDERYLPDTLAISEDASVFIQCSIIIQEGGRDISSSSDPILSIMYQRWKKLSYRCYPILSREILERGSKSLNSAIKKSWTAYQPGTGWQVVSGFNQWLSTQTAPQDNGDSLSVDFNLLTSELLVNGLPLARLPSQYERHPTYRTLFGRSALEVMLSAVQGMQFSGKKPYAGYNLHFNLNPIAGAWDSSVCDFLVYAEKGDQKYQLFPSRIFCDDLPASFVNNFVHWYNINDRCIEFRPIEDPWTSNPTNWKLTRAKTGSEWLLVAGGVSLVGIKSETSKILSRILSPLEDPLWIHVIFHHSSSILEIELPRLQLGFHLESLTSSIKSRQFRGFVVDQTQSLATLVGLHNRLLLVNETTGKRLVIIPEGDVMHQTNGNHIRITIDRNTATRAHSYYIDDQIGRLVDNGSLQSKLFLCYLHALTSFCLPDPFMHRTGTEQALSILASAAVRSFDRLTKENVELLVKIGALTPERHYYPSNERVMQSVEWSSVLSFLAQHGGFYKGVKSIFEQAERAKVFHPVSSINLPPLGKIQLDLMERDCIRSSTFRVSGFGAEDHSEAHDRIYQTRDRNQNSDEGFKAFVMSSIIYHRKSTPHYCVGPNLKDHLWNFLANSNVQVLGLQGSLSSSELKYDAGLLQSSSGFISKHWITLHRAFRQQNSTVDRFRLMMWLSTLAFAKNADMQMIQTLACFFTLPEMTRIKEPQVQNFLLSQGKSPQVSTIVRSARLPISRCPEAELKPQAQESKNAFGQRQQREFHSNQDRTINKMVSALLSQVPRGVPVLPADEESAKFGTYINVADAIQRLKPTFKIAFENLLFYEYLGDINNTIKNQPVIQIEMPSFYFDVPASNPQRRPGFISINEVYDCEAPLASLPGTKNMMHLLNSTPSSSQTTPRLPNMIDELELHAAVSYEKNYVQNLRASMSSLQETGKNYSLQMDGLGIAECLTNNRNLREEEVKQVYAAILSALNFSHEKNSPPLKKKFDSSTIAAAVNQWPRLSSIFLLHQLSRHRWQRISSGWKHYIVQYGLALTELQRAERLLKASGNTADLIKELQNCGHMNWNPLERPEMLLLEVESSILIREVQEQIAEQMRDPPSGKNSVMQLNMGEGKSSVIVPMVAAALANGTQLVHVLVAKPQSKQMFEMLVSKLGGLLDRRVYHMPFSRALRLSQKEAKSIGNIYKECMEKGGILLVQPEHILSFKLMGLECLISGKEIVGRYLLETQEFFESSSRDIVDESDENFSVKFELIYTMGMQRSIEMSPERWTCIHQILDLVKMILPEVKKEFPDSIDVYERCRGSFPRTRILRLDAQLQVFGKVAEHICKTGLNGFAIARQPESVREAVLKYIVEPNLTVDEIARVEDQGAAGFWSSTTSSTLLLLRGLVAGGVLAFAFNQKRWRVNYGLDTTRKPGTKLAVPFRAKDSPTPRSEFSHPDVVIVLTSLSYYYGGLTNEDLFLAFGHLLKSDQADSEYQAWVKDALNLPVPFHQLVGINLKDQLQCIDTVFPPFLYAKSVVDYFLAHIVFPKEMKEFPHKLSVSGWDIGQTKTHPTTGFSGTNDSQKLLPLSMEHIDLPEQKHTNALVLEYLLQPENSVALIPPRSTLSSSDAELLLNMVCKMSPTTQVILDVGAQILELSNLGVARKWLEMTSNYARVQAAVFFSDKDELSVLDRKGNVEPLQTSSYAQQLDLCLVFLDEAHTRGTDLRLPAFYRAAVTLGPNLTKDRLVQACMRMRQLGKGQSVVFCVPEEIKTKVLERTSDTTIQVSDILTLAISDTYLDIRRSMPLWAAQGQRFEHQNTLWAEARTKGNIMISMNQANKFLEDESRSLKDRYRPRIQNGMSSLMQKTHSGNFGLIVERCREFDNLEFNSATLQEEQERELSPEIEQERQVERPAFTKPAAHDIHNDLRQFVATGNLLPGSKAYMPAFEVLRNTSAAKHLAISQFPDELLATADFARTVEVSGSAYISDAYQRPVQWILTSSLDLDADSMNVCHMVLISPYEAQELLPAVQESKTVTMHLYAPRPNLGLRATDKLDLFSIPTRAKKLILPRRLVVQLNLFAGQLYLSSFKEYVEVCKFLGLAWDTPEEGCVVALDGFIIKDNREAQESQSAFTDSPVKFLKVLMTKIRRNCEGIDKTHMGKLLDGSLLCASDFEDLGQTDE